MTISDREEEKLRLKTVDQVGVVVENCDAVIASWEKMFGIGPWTTIVHKGQDPEGNPLEVKLAFAYLGDLELELIEVVKGRIFHSQSLEKHGEGLHHLGFFVDDVNGEAAKLVAEGAKILAQDPGNWIYLDPGGPGGVIFELIRRHGKIKRA